MKQASLLIILCALFNLSASAQTTTIEKSPKRITITTTKVDENGQSVTETWIAEGDQPEKILGNMAVNPDALQKLKVDDQANMENGERLFLFRKAGDKTVIEGTLSGNGESINNEAPNSGEVKKIMIINDDDKSVGEKWHEKICRFHCNPSGASGWVHGKDGNTNCAALGVYVNNYGAEGESKISSLIDKGGAQEAGLQEGDVIKKIDEYDIADFPSLRLALSHYQPGDIVTVRYVRNDKNQKARVELKDWAQLPGFEWRARTDCGNDQAKKEDKVFNIAPSANTGIQPLELQDARIYPNPTEGVFAFSFHTASGPIAISITDVNGKVVYRENNDNTSGSYNRDIDLKELPQGNYIISVSQGDKVFTQQISKQ